MNAASDTVSRGVHKDIILYCMVVLCSGSHTDDWDFGGRENRASVTGGPVQADR